MRSSLRLSPRAAGARLVGAFAFAAMTITPVQAKVFAISCSGSSEITFNGPPKSKTNVNETRVFIVDEEAKSVAFYNEILGAPVSLCPTGASSCVYDFYPNEIMLTSGGPGRLSVAMLIDRAVGAIWLLMYFDDRHREFKGGCKPIEVPTANTKYNAF